MTASPSRKEYILQQKRDHNRPAVAVLPVHYPKEILTALDILSVEIWGPPGYSAGAGAARIQPYICAVARNAMSFIEAGKADVVDGILFPHTCDCLQNLASLVPEWGSWKKPVFHFQHPRGPRRPQTYEYLKEELQSLIAALEKAFNRRLVPEKLNAAIESHEESDRLIRELFAKRRHFAGGNRELYNLLRQGEYLWIEDNLALLRQAAARLAAAPIKKVYRCW